jgi:hypothetical protein
MCPSVSPPLQYVHPTPIIPVSAIPQGDALAQMGVFAFHHMELCDGALKAAKSSSIALPPSSTTFLIVAACAMRNKT